MQEQSLSIPDFLGGINEFIDEGLIKLNETNKAFNVVIDDGTLGSIKGTTLYTSASTTSIGSIMTYYKNDVGMILIASGSTVYKLEGNVLTSIATGFTNDKFDFINFRVEDTDIIIFGNGAEPTKVYDGNTVADLKHDGKASAVSPTNISPKGNIMELHYERMWIANDNTVYFSTANVNGFDVHDWTSPVNEEDVNQHGGFIEIYTNDGSKIIGLKVIFDDILIFKNKSVFKIFGSNPQNYTKIQIFSSNGAIADRSIVGTNAGAFFINKDGIYQYDGTNVNLISDKIRKTFLGLNKTALNNSCATFFNHKYILAVPDGSSSTNNLIIEYDVRSRSFMFRKGIEVTQFIEFEDKLLFVNTEGKIFEYNTGTTFNGNTINSYYETGTTDMNFPNAVKTIDYIYFTGSGSGDLKITCKTDNTTTPTKTVTVPLSSTEKVYKIKLKGRGRLLKFIFENVNGSSFTIKKIKILLDIDLD